MRPVHELTSSEPDDEVLPRKFDRYELLKKLATGGMAELYLAKQSGLEGFEKVVVLKRILGHLAQDIEFISMFLDEARIAAKLSHPNIVQIYDLGKADDTYYIAMEYVSGRNVQDLIAKQQEQGTTLPVEHVCRIIAGVCDGLHYAHSRKDYDGRPLNIIHRDVSPQNILVSFAGGVKVVDFGIAKASTQIAQTRAGVLKGKFAYMSPEQVRGTRLDHRSDIFALGLVFYEMLTGVRPFERDSSLKTLKAIVQDKPVNPTDLNPDIPPEVVKLLAKALEKNPDRRYKTAQDMQLALEDFLESSPKKSNNVRISRFMYELFDDEVNSVEGTLVVQGVGEVIVPASGQGKKTPKVEEDVDHRTLSAALAPHERGPKSPDNAEVAASRVDLSPKAPAAPQKPSRGEQAGVSSRDARSAVPSVANVDFEAPTAFERALEKSVTDPAPQVGPVPPSELFDRSAPTAYHRAPPSEAEDAASKLGSSSNGRRHEDSRQRARRSIADDEVQPATDPLAPQASLIVGPNGPITPPSERSRSQARPEPAAAVAPGIVSESTAGPLSRVDETGASGTQVGPRMVSDPSQTAAVEPAPATLTDRSQDVEVNPRSQAAVPPLFYAGLAAVAGIFLLASAFLVVLLRALAPMEYGLVVVTTEPPNATVFIDGEDMGQAPVQAAVPMGQAFTVEAEADGYVRSAPTPVAEMQKTLLELGPIVLKKSAPGT